MSFKNWLAESEGKILYIMRGPPGSGKSSTVMRLVKDGGQVFSTDDFFGSGDEYIEKMTHARKYGLMPHYHQQLMKMVAEALSKGISPIVIDNTNITKKHMEPYVKMGVHAGYEVRFVEPNSPVWKRLKPLLYHKDPNALSPLAHELSGLNKHGVPAETILDMLRSWHNDPKVADFYQQEEDE